MRLVKIMIKAYTGAGWKLFWFNPKEFSDEAKA